MSDVKASSYDPQNSNEEADNESTANDENTKRVAKT